METVEVLVRIPKKDFEELQSNYVWWGKHGEYIKNGTVIPEGHGRLIDADKYKFDNEDAFCIGFGDDAMNVFKRSVDNTPTVIEADREAQDEK